MSFLGVCAGGMCRRTGRVQEREREREFSPLETPSLPPLPCPYRRTESTSQHLLLHLPPSPLILAVSLSSPIDQSSNSSSHGRGSGAASRKNSPAGGVHALRVLHVDPEFVDYTVCTDDRGAGKRHRGRDRHIFNNLKLKKSLISCLILHNPS